MRRIDRLDLVDRIGRELQSRMSYTDIDSYLTACGVDCRKETSAINSKWIYVKELLADETDQTILKIADELEIDHGFSTSQGRDLSESKIWVPDHFRLFLSHISSVKVKITALQRSLRPYGISAFVAHEDIEPTKEWQDEIEKALLSMDALAAILTPGFHESKWTDQEVGVAVGRELLIIPIRRGLDPYGFIAKFQGLQTSGKSVSQVADAVFGVLSSNSKTYGLMAGVLIRLLLHARDDDDLDRWSALLDRFSSIPVRSLETLQKNAPTNDAIVASEDLVDRLNSLLDRYGVERIVIQQPAKAFDEYDIPF